MDFITQTKEVPVVGSYDVVVCGGGPAGLSAKHQPVGGGEPADTVGPVHSAGDLPGGEQAGHAGERIGIGLDAAVGGMGKDADVAIFRGNPITDLQYTTAYTIINGEIVHQA